MGWFGKLFKKVVPHLPVIGDLVGAGMAFLGGRASRRENRRAVREASDRQEEFARHGVQWRVEDAKAAGVGPLAALGMQAVPFSPSIVSDTMGQSMAEAGQGIARAASRSMSAHERAMQQLALISAEKGLEESDARISVLRSEAFRNMQEANEVKTFPVPDPFWDQFGAAASERVLGAPEGSVPVGRVTPKAPDVLSAAPSDVSAMAGVTPLWRQFQLAPGLPIDLPGGVSGDAAEVLESLAESPALMAIVLKHNADKYGPEWRAKAMGQVPGWSALKKVWSSLPFVRIWGGSPGKSRPVAGRKFIKFKASREGRR